MGPLYTGDPLMEIPRWNRPVNKMISSFSECNDYLILLDDLLSSSIFFEYKSRAIVPLDIGEIICSITLMDPALQPAIVTLLGSPPNAAMFRCTHLRAAT